MSRRHANEHRGGAGLPSSFSQGDDAMRTASSGDTAYFDYHQPAFSGESATAAGPSTRRQVSQAAPASQYPRPHHRQQQQQQQQHQQQQPQRPHQQQQQRQPPYQSHANAGRSTEVPYIPAPSGGHAYLMRNDPPAPLHATEEWRSTAQAPQRAGSSGALRGHADPYRVPNPRREGGRPNFVPRRDENEAPRHFASNRGPRLSEGPPTRPPPTSHLQQHHQQPSPPQQHLQQSQHPQPQQQQQQQGLHELARHMGERRAHSKDGSARGRGGRGAKRATPSSTTGSSAPITPEQRPAQPSGPHARRLGKIGTPPAAGGDSSASDSASGPPKPRPDMSGRRLAQLDHDFGEDKRLVLSVLKEKARNMGLAEASGRVGGGEEAEESHRTQQRRKQILFGKVTTGYRRYVANVPPFLRHRGNAFHAATPRADVKCSKRRWDLLMQIWRRELHLWDADQFDAVDAMERSRMLAGVDDVVARDGVKIVAVDGAAVESADAALVDYRRQLQSALDRVARSVEGTFKTGAPANEGTAVTASPAPMSNADSDEPIAALDALERAQWSLRTVPECVQSPAINLVPSASTTPGAAGSSPVESPSANGLSAPPDTTASTPRVAATDVPSSVSSNSPHADDAAPPPPQQAAAKTPVSRRRPEPLNAADAGSSIAGGYSGAPLPSPAREAANGPPLNGRPIALIISGQVYEKQVKTGGPMAFRVDTPDGGTPQEVFRELEATFHVANLSFHVVPGAAPLPPPMSAPQPKPFVSPNKSDAPPEPSEHTATPARTNLDVSETMSGGTPTSVAMPHEGGRTGTLPPTTDTSGQSTPSTSPQPASVDDVSAITSARESPITSAALPVGQRTPEQHSRGVPAAAVRPPCAQLPAATMGPRRSSFADEYMQPQRSPPIAGSVGRLERSRSSGNPIMSPVNVGSPGTVRPSVYSSDSKMPSAPIVVGRHGAKPGRNHEHLPVPELTPCALHSNQQQQQCTVYRLNRVQNVAYFLSFYESGLPLVYLDNGEGEGAFKTNGGYKHSLEYWRSVTPLLSELQDGSSHAPDLAFRNTVSPDAFTGILGSTPMAPDGRTDVNRFWTQTPGKTPVHALRGDTQTPQELNGSLRDARPHSRSSPSGPAGRAMRHTPGHNERFSQDRDESVARHTTRSAAQSPKGTRDDEHNGAPSPAGIEVANAVRR